MRIGILILSFPVKSLPLAFVAIYPCCSSQVSVAVLEQLWIVQGEMAMPGS